ncbi:MAG: hypothetical protein ACREFJ_19500 [Acetobacteraceae bacterium]
MKSSWLLAASAAAIIATGTTFVQPAASLEQAKIAGLNAQTHAARAARVAAGAARQ